MCTAVWGTLDDRAGGKTASGLLVSRKLSCLRCLSQSLTSLKTAWGALRGLTCSDKTKQPSPLTVGSSELLGGAGLANLASMSGCLVCCSELYAHPGVCVSSPVLPWKQQQDSDPNGAHLPLRTGKPAVASVSYEQKTSGPGGGWGREQGADAGTAAATDLAPQGCCRCCGSLVTRGQCPSHDLLCPCHLPPSLQECNYLIIGRRYLSITDLPTVFTSICLSKRTISSFCQHGLFRERVHASVYACMRPAPFPVCRGAFPSCRPRTQGLCWRGQKSRDLSC